MSGMSVSFTRRKLLSCLKNGSLVLRCLKFLIDCLSTFLKLLKTFRILLSLTRTSLYCWFCMSWIGIGSGSKRGRKYKITLNGFVLSMNNRVGWKRKNKFDFFFFYFFLFFLFLFSDFFSLWFFFSFLIIFFLFTKLKPKQ